MTTELVRIEGEPFLDGIFAFTGTAVRRLKATIREHGIAWAIAIALLLGIAVPVMVGLLLKALGLIHGASLHAGLLDAGSNVNRAGAGGSVGSGVAAGAGRKPFTPTPGYLGNWRDDPAYKKAQQDDQSQHPQPAPSASPSPSPSPTQSWEDRALKGLTEALKGNNPIGTH